MGQGVAEAQRWPVGRVHPASHQDLPVLMLVPELNSRGWKHKGKTLHTTVIRCDMQAILHVQEMWCKPRVLSCTSVPLSNLKQSKLSSSCSPATQNHEAQGGD